jgi:hypothetical protein
VSHGRADILSQSQPTTVSDLILLLSPLKTCQSSAVEVSDLNQVKLHQKEAILSPSDNETEPALVGIATIKWLLPAYDERDTQAYKKNGSKKKIDLKAVPGWVNPL